MQAWDRYAYSNNNPVRYTDPTGHCVFGGIDTLMCAGAAVGVVLYTANIVRSGQDWQLKDAALAAGVGAVSGLLIGGAAAAVAAGVISTTVAAVTTGSGVGMATGAGSYLAINTITGSRFDEGDFAIAASVGGATGALGPIAGTTATGAAALNAASGAAQYEMTYYHHTGDLDLDQDVLWAAGASAATTIATGAYQSPTSYYSNINPTPTDSSIIWHQYNGWSTTYPNYVNNPYAQAWLAGNLTSASLKQIGVASTANSSFNWFSQHLHHNDDEQ